MQTTYGRHLLAGCQDIVYIMSAVVFLYDNLPIKELLTDYIIM